jgi:hypothetical protein
MKRLVMLLAAMVAMTAGSVEAQAPKRVVLMADLSGANAVPPMMTLAGGFAVAYFDVQVDGLFVRGAKVGLDVYLTGLPSASTITGAVIRKGPVGVNGPIRVDSGISPANPIVVPGSSITFSRPDLLVTPTDAAAITGTPDHFYVEALNTFNPTVPVRGQLRFVDPFQFALPFPGVVASVYLNQATYVAGERFQARVVTGNYDVPRQADIFVGLVLSPAESAARCPTANDRALQFRGPGGATTVECQSNLTKPGNNALPLLTNVTLPVQGLRVIPVADETITLTPGQRSFFVCAAPPGTVQTGNPSLVRCATASFSVLLL